MVIENRKIAATLLALAALAALLLAWLATASGYWPEAHGAWRGWPLPALLAAVLANMLAVGSYPFRKRRKLAASAFLASLLAAMLAISLLTALHYGDGL